MKRVVRNLGGGALAVAVLVPLLAGTVGVASLVLLATGAAVVVASRSLGGTAVRPGQDVWASPAPPARAGTAGAAAPPEDAIAPGACDVSGPGVAALVPVGFEVARGASARPTNTAVAAALARIEARELVRSPWLAAGLALSILPIVALAASTGAGGISRAEVALLAPWIIHPLAGLVVVAVHRATTRARRDGAEELVAACPAAPAARTLGVLGSAWVPATLAAAAIAGHLIVTEVRNPGLWGALDADALGVIVAAVALGAGAVALGSALGTWAPWRAVPVAAVVAVGIASLRLDASGEPGWNRLAVLSTAPAGPDIDPLFLEPRAWAHLLWIVGLTVAVAGIALARHDRGRGGVAVLATGAVLAAGAALAATRPLDEGTARRLADLALAAPGTQVCVPAGGATEVCGLRAAEEVVVAVAEAAAPVLDAAPPEAVAGLTLRQVLDGDVADLQPEVRALVAAATATGGGGAGGGDRAGVVPFGFDRSSSELAALRLRVALALVDLPFEEAPNLLPVPIDGRAGGVVALWLAARGLPAAEARRLASADPDDLPTGSAAFDRGHAWPACESPPVVWSGQDLAAARAVLALPDEQVQAVVSDGWSRWLDRSTGTDELLAELGLASAGPYENVLPTTVPLEC